MVTKIIAGVVAVGLVTGIGIGISKIARNTSQSVSEKVSGIKGIGSSTTAGNMEWEKLLGKSKDEIIVLLGQPRKEDKEELYYDIHYNNGNILKAALKIYIEDNNASLISSGAGDYYIQGIKKGDNLEKVKSTFEGITGAALDSENVDCGDLTAVFYTIGDYMYQFLYDNNEVVQHLGISLIRHEEYVENTSAVEEQQTPEAEKPSQVTQTQPERSEVVKDNVPAEQVPEEKVSPVTVNRMAVEDLIFADKQTIIKKMGKPVADDSKDNSTDLLYDGINFHSDFSNKELEFSTHQQNYLITMNDSRYSAYGFYPGMTKEELMKNTKNYPVEEVSDGTYEFALPGNGTTVHVYIDFSTGGNTASEVTMQAFVEW